MALLWALPRNGCCILKTWRGRAICAQFIKRFAGSHKLPPTSAHQGHALEYLFAKEMREVLPACHFTERAERDQCRDASKHENLDKTMQLYFKKGVGSFLQWFLPTFRSSIDAGPCELDRLPDSAGVQGDVTDIRLNFADDSVFNLSIKHNHDAIKHPRPMSIPSHCGFSSGDQELEAYVSYYKSSIRQPAIEAYNLEHPDKSFSQVEEEHPEYKAQLVYEPIVDHVVAFLGGLAPHNQASFYKWLCGCEPFYKVIVRRKRTEVFDYTSIEFAKSLKVYKEASNYVVLEPNVGFGVKMRIKNDSSDVVNFRMKLDAQRVGKAIPIFFRKY